LWDFVEDTPQVHARTRGDKSSAVSVRDRRARLDDYIATGLSDAEICRAEDIGRTTLWRDMAQRKGQLDAAMSARRDAIAFKLYSRYERIYDEAMGCHTAERADKVKWLGTEDNYDRVAFLPAMDGGSVEEHKPPPVRFAEAQYLNTAMAALKEMAKLVGLDATTTRLEVSGRDGKPLAVKHDHTYEPGRPHTVVNILVDAGVLALPPGGLGDAGHSIEGQ
jgi:hypothetical protein